MVCTMIFVESAVFTADVKELLSDEEYSALQAHLVERPDVGDLIQQTGGLRRCGGRLKGEASAAGRA
jgi:hypothetical protein